MQSRSVLETRRSLLSQGLLGRPFIDRDLSWLQFNDRVLTEARDSKNPLLERAKFLGISGSNLDEFFAIRFASLNRSMAAAIKAGENKKIKRYQQVRSMIMHEVGYLGEMQDRTLRELTAALKAFKIEIHRRWSTDAKAKVHAEKLFSEQILPLLAPPEKFTAKKITFLENLQAAILLSNQHWLPIPKKLPSVLWTHADDQKIHIFFLDELISTQLPKSLGIDGESCMIRLTRDGDISVDLEEEDTESIPDAVRTSISNREKGRPVRLQTAGKVPNGLLPELLRAAHLEERQVYILPQTLCLQGLAGVINHLPEAIRDNPKLCYPAVKPYVPKPFSGAKSVFERLKLRDFLLHHPYDSFEAFVGWIQAACSDPVVTEIALTVYRTDAVSPIISALKSAAKTKRIQVIIELRARFDELNNLRLAEELRQAGIQVAFGFGKLKLHAKIAIITRKEDGQFKFYTHLSTGNYNAATSRQYTDLAIITANQDIGLDARNFFDTVWNGRIPSSLKRLVSAPGRLHKRILHHIEEEILAAHQGKPARIVVKVNALVDEGVIDHLYRASQAGVQIDLIVRGACSLVPGVKGLSDNIRVISIVDRFLEHSRIYYFESTGAMYLSSADWMPRNFFSRLEITFPVLDQRIHAYLKDVVIPTYLADTVKAQELTSEGFWVRRVASSKSAQVRSQFYFQDLTEKHYRGSPLDYEKNSADSTTRSSK